MWFVGAGWAKHLSILKQYSITLAPDCARLWPVTICNISERFGFVFRAWPAEIDTPSLSAVENIFRVHVSTGFGARKRPGQILSSVKVDNHGEDFRIFEYFWGAPKWLVEIVTFQAILFPSRRQNRPNGQVGKPCAARWLFEIFIGSCTQNLMSAHQNTHLITAGRIVYNRSLG